MNGDAVNDNKKQSGRFYFGFSIAYPAVVFGGMEAQYIHETDAFRTPGSFERSEFQTGNYVPIQFSVGTTANKNLRVDISYLRYYDVSMVMASSELLPLDPLLTAHTGGFCFVGSSPSITSDVILPGVYYNFLDNLIGHWSLRPYVGAGIGMASNSISDYTILDKGAYLFPGIEGTIQPVGTVIGFHNIAALHKGGTTTNVAWLLELGATINLTHRTLVDFFGRYVNLGRVESNTIIVSQQYLEAKLDNNPVGPPFNFMLGEESTSSFPNRRESGTLSFLDIGVRLRFLF